MRVAVTVLMVLGGVGGLPLAGAQQWAGARYPQYQPMPQYQPVATPPGYTPVAQIPYAGQPTGYPGQAAMAPGMAMPVQQQGVYGPQQPAATPNWAYHPGAAPPQPVARGYAPQPGMAAQPMYRQPGPPAGYAPQAQLIRGMPYAGQPQYGPQPQYAPQQSYAPQPQLSYPQPRATATPRTAARVPAWSYADEAAAPTPAQPSIGPDPALGGQPTLEGPGTEETTETMVAGPEMVGPGTDPTMMEPGAACGGDMGYGDPTGACGAPPCQQGGHGCCPLRGHGCGGCGGGGCGMAGFGGGGIGVGVGGAGYGMGGVAGGYGMGAGGYGMGSGYGMGAGGYGMGAGGYGMGAGGYGMGGGGYGMGGGGYGMGGSGCGADPCGAVPCCRPQLGWFGSIGAVVMGRDRPNRVYFSADANNLANQNQSGEDVVGDWNVGPEVNFGQQFCSGCAWGVTFWMIDSLQNSSNVTGTLVTPINLNYLPPLNGQPVAYYFDGSPEHRLYRNDAFYNLELNVFSAPAGNPCGCFAFRWLAGVRWLRFDESLVFGGVAGGSYFGANGGNDEAYYDVSVVSNLIGPQIGGVGRWQICNRLAAYISPKVGLMVNYMEQRSALYTGSGVYGFDIGSTKTDLSLLSSIDVGMSVQVTRCWYLYGGYRVVGLTGVGLADEQVPFYLNDYPEINRVDSNGSLILHGAMFGAGFCF